MRHLQLALMMQNSSLTIGIAGYFKRNGVTVKMDYESRRVLIVSASSDVVEILFPVYLLDKVRILLQVELKSSEAGLQENLHNVQRVTRLIDNKIKWVGLELLDRVILFQQPFTRYAKDNFVRLNNSWQVVILILLL